MTVLCRPPRNGSHRDLADENRIRRDHLIRLLGEMLADASYFVAGQRLEVSASASQKALSEALEYLIQNTFNKMSYLKTLRDNPHKEIQAVLRSNDIGQYNLNMDLPRATHRPLKTFALTSNFARRPTGRLYLA